jgi:hypothetical protein
MVAAISRLVISIMWVVLAAAMLYVVVWILNRGLQLLARSLGYELKDFGGWLMSLRKKPEEKTTPVEAQLVSTDFSVTFVYSAKMKERYEMLTEAERRAFDAALRSSAERLFEKFGSTRTR